MGEGVPFGVDYFVSNSNGICKQVIPLAKIPLSLEDSFLIKCRGLVLIPKLIQPQVSGFKAFSGSIDITFPGGEIAKWPADFLCEHFSLLDSSGQLIGQLKIVILLPQKTREDLPDGCEISVTEDIFSLLQFTQ
jgi:hypothetical protein